MGSLWGRHGRPTEVVSDQGGQLTSSDNAGKTDSLNWEQVEDREAERGTAWEFVPTGGQWRNKLAESRVKVIKATLEAHAPLGAGWRGADPELQRALHGPGDGSQRG